MSANEGSDESAAVEHGSLSAIGAELAAGRKKMDLSLEAAAASLHLGPEMLRALEAGDEAKLPAAAFVRGYIKSYARLLGLPEAALIARLPDSSAQRVVPLKRVGMRRRRVSLPVGKWLVRGLALAAVLLVLVFAGPLVERLWSDKDPQAVSDALQIPQPASEAEAQLEYIDIPSQENAAEPGDDVTEQPASPQAEPQSAAPEKAAQPATTAPPAAQDQSGPAVVTLRFLDDSWVEMEANGRKLVVGTQRAGSERRVTAEPPVFILLGNAPAVELTYRGEPVDLTPYQRGNVARVTLED